MKTAPSCEDALAYLPCSHILAFGKGQVIYDHQRPSTAIYLVIDGKVKVSRVTDGGRQVIIDIYQPDEFFGEAAFLGLPAAPEQVTAIEDVRLMTWSASDLVELITRQPRLGIALLQIAVQRILDAIYRIQSFSADSIAQRLARTLIRFAERLGGEEQDGMVRMLPFTHETLAQYVGTSREIVTHWMARLQRDGCIHYSRRGILLHRETLRKWIEKAPKDAPTAPPAQETAPPAPK